MKRGKNGGQSGPELGGTGPKKLSETVMWCLLLLILAVTLFCGLLRREVETSSYLRHIVCITELRARVVLEL